MGKQTLYQELSSQADASFKYAKNFQDDDYCSWDEKEALLLGRPKDSVTNTTKSQIFDPRLSTIVLERAARVMAQHATGRTQAIDTVKDKGKNALMDLTMQKYVIPGADSQYDLLTKFRLEMVYSNVYGTFGHYIDYRVDDDYIGPDMWLVPMRHIAPEPNAASKNDCNFMFMDTWVTSDWLEARPQGKESGWKNIGFILDQVKEKAGKAKPSEKQSYSEQTYGDSTYGGKGKYAQIQIRTRFERDRWVRYCPDFGGFKSQCIIQDIENPHGNNEIPLVFKQTFPMLDRFWGLGEFERGKTLQYAINSLWNLYLDGVKMSIFPPMIYVPGQVYKSTLKYGPAERWAEKMANSIRQYQTSPQGTNTFMSTFGVLNSSLLNLAGTTDTTVSADTDPTQGKTPQALKMVASREAARDNWERYMMEKSVEETMNIFMDLLVTKQDKPINLNLLEGEIQKLQQEFPEESGQLMEVFESGKFANLKVSKKDLAAKYRFYIDTGSTMKKDEATEHVTLMELLTLLTKIPGLAQQIPNGVIQVGSTSIDVGQIIKRYIISSGAQDWEKIVIENKQNPELANQPPIDLSRFQNSTPEVQQLVSAIANSVGGPGQVQGVPQPQQPPMNGQMPSQGMPNGQGNGGMF